MSAVRGGETMRDLFESMQIAAPLDLAHNAEHGYLNPWTNEIYQAFRCGLRAACAMRIDSCTDWQKVNDIARGDG